MNFNDLESSVPPEESNDDLLDQAWNDHAGESLDAKKVKEARQLEMEYYDNMHVFDKVPIAQCWERTGKASLKARWVDIDKGTRYRSRWVAKQFKGSDSEEWFAATWPIEALRALISHTMSWDTRVPVALPPTLQEANMHFWSFRHWRVSICGSCVPKKKGVVDTVLFLGSGARTSAKVTTTTDFQAAVDAAMKKRFGV